MNTNLAELATETRLKVAADLWGERLSAVFQVLDLIAPIALENNLVGDLPRLLLVRIFRLAADEFCLKIAPKPLVAQKALAAPEVSKIPA